MLKLKQAVLNFAQTTKFKPRLRKLETQFIQMIFGHRHQFSQYCQKKDENESKKSQFLINLYFPSFILLQYVILQTIFSLPGLILSKVPILVQGSTRVMSGDLSFSFYKNILGIVLASPSFFNLRGLFLSKVHSKFLEN